MAAQKRIEEFLANRMNDPKYAKAGKLAKGLGAAGVVASALNPTELNTNEDQVTKTN